MVSALELCLHTIVFMTVITAHDYVVTDLRLALHLVERCRALPLLPVADFADTASALWPKTLEVHLCKGAAESCVAN